jgi:hypothetical protein
MANFGVKSTKKIFLYGYLLKNKIIYNFMIFVAIQNCRTKKISSSSFGAVVGSGIWDPGETSGIWDPGETSRIRITAFWVG